MAFIDTATRSQLIQLYVAYFNRAPDADGLAYWSDKVANGGWTVATVARSFMDQTEVQSAYPNYMTSQEIVTKVYSNVLGRTADAAGNTYWVNQLTTGAVSKADLIQAVVNAANEKDATGAYKNATDAAILTNKTTVGEYFAVTLGSNDKTKAASVMSGVTSDAATVDTAKAAAVSANGQTYTLTTGSDTFTGTANNDTFSGTTADTLSVFDTIDGGAGVDTLNANLTGTSMPASTTITNIEKLNVTTTGAGFTLDTTSLSGMTDVSVKDSAAGAISVTAASTTAATITGTGASAVTVVGTGGSLGITTGAGAVTVGGTAVANAITAASVTGGTTVAITDRSGTSAATADKLATVSLNGNTGAATLTTNGLTTLNLKNNAQNVTVTDATAAGSSTRALTVNLDTATGGVISDSKAKTVTVNSNGTTANTGVTLTTVNATTVNMKADAIALTVADVNLTAATAINLSGAKAITVSATSDVSALTTVTSTNTAGVTITPALAAGVTFTGGDGNDTITLSATGTKAMTMGAGNDTVVYAGPMGTGGSVDAGAGTDTIKMTAAQAVTATGSTTFAGTVSNFEKLELSAATGAAAAINMANADGINSLVLNGVTVGALTVTNAGANFTYTNKAAVAFASSISLASDTGTSDVVNVVYTANDGFADTAAMTIANVETINISTLDADTTAQTTKFTANLVTAAAKTINISGDTGVTLTDTSTSMTTVDASGLTGTVAAASGFTWTTGALAASSTIKGSAAATNTVDFSAANTASTSVTYVGGTGNDAITGSNGLNNTVTLGDGTNSFTSTGAGNNTVTGGSGVDTISVGSGNNTISTGAGNDSITFGGGMNTITGGAGNDTFTISAAGANVNTYSTITDASAGDILTFTNQGTETFATAKLTLGDTAVFQDYANLAASGDGSTNAAIKWFQYNGNTYVVEDLSAGASFVNGTDLIIKLTGLVDLSTATGAGTNAITLA